MEDISSAKLLNHPGEQNIMSGDAHVEDDTASAGSAVSVCDDGSRHSVSNFCEELYDSHEVVINDDRIRFEGLPGQTKHMCWLGVSRCECVKDDVPEDGFRLKTGFVAAVCRLLPDLASGIFYLWNHFTFWRKRCIWMHGRICRLGVDSVDVAERLRLAEDRLDRLCRDSAAMRSDLSDVERIVSLV